jgi:hypothetical protein
MQLVLLLGSVAGGCETAGQARRQPGKAPEAAPTIHDPAQLWFAFVREAGQ